MEQFPSCAPGRRPRASRSSGLLVAFRVTSEQRTGLHCYFFKVKRHRFCVLPLSPPGGGGLPPPSSAPCSTVVNACAAAEGRLGQCGQARAGVSRSRAAGVLPGGAAGPRAPPSVRFGAHGFARVFRTTLCSQATRGGGAEEGELGPARGLQGRPRRARESGGRETPGVGRSGFPATLWSLAPRRKRQVIRLVERTAGLGCAEGAGPAPAWGQAGGGPAEVTSRRTLQRPHRASSAPAGLRMASPGPGARAISLKPRLQLQRHVPGDRN